MSLPVPKAFSLICVLFLFLNGRSYRDAESIDKCDSFSAEARITKSTQSTNRYDVVIEPTGGVKPFKFVFVDDQNLLLSSDFNKDRMVNVKEGKYMVIVFDRQNCKKELYFEVK
jgi:hypothetical protein